MQIWRTSHSLWKDTVAIERNNGILAALSILVPEQNSGLELPALVKEDYIRNPLIKITVRSFPSREPATFSSASQSLIREALRMGDFSVDAMDGTIVRSMVTICYDAFWVDRLLKQQRLAERDAYWCGFLMIDLNHMEQYTA